MGDGGEGRERNEARVPSEVKPQNQPDPTGCK